MGTLEQIDALETQSSCSSSSIDSSKHSGKPAPSSSSVCLSSVCTNGRSTRTNLRTDFTLGLSISPSSQPESASYSTPREQTFDWPPIQSTYRSTILEKYNQLSQRPSLFVKAYMEGIPVGRKLNLLEYCSYDGLVEALGHMFRTIILCPYSQPLVHSENFHVLTYEDQEGDWMMVGDVPWEMFLTSVKRLKITRADRC